MNRAVIGGYIPQCWSFAHLYPNLVVNVMGNPLKLTYNTIIFKKKTKEEANNNYNKQWKK